MSYGIRITGIKEIQRKLGIDLNPAIKAATMAIALEIQNEVAPYSPASAANSPSSNRWYERGYGPKWRLKDGAVHGRKTSETLGRRWGIATRGRVGHVLGNIASYAKWVHGEKTQARVHKARGWVTDETAIARVIRSGVVQRHIKAAVMAALRRR